MITVLNESSRKEAAFKASSKNQSENLDDAEALFIKKLEKGTRKYKGNLPLKFFKYTKEMKKLAVIRKIKRVKLYTRRNLLKKRKTSIP